MNWKSATRAQLYEIAFNDHGASLPDRSAAAAEIKRRNRRNHGMVNYKLKAVYPR
jgi:hypothetical protein